MDHFLPTIPVALRGSHSWVLILTDNPLNRVLANFLLSNGASHGSSHCADAVAPYPEYTRYKRADVLKSVQNERFMAELHDWVNELLIFLNRLSIILAEVEEIRDYLLALMILTEVSNLRQFRYYYEIDHFSDHLNVCKTVIFPAHHQAKRFLVRRGNRSYPKPVSKFFNLCHQY